MLKDLSIRQLLGRRVLIVGDVGSGKTKLTAKLLEEAVGLGYADEITVIDMAPKTINVGGMRVGGLLSEATASVSRVRYWRPKEVKAPRTTAKTPEQLLAYVQFNKEAIEPLLDKFIKEPTPILIINDLSIYLQAGEPRKVVLAMEKCQTFIANCYKGEKLAKDLGTGVSRVERDATEFVEHLVDVVIRL